MSRWPEIDWDRFADDVDPLLEQFTASGVSMRTIEARRNISIATLSRARKGIVLSAGNFIAVCALLKLEPAHYLKSGIEPHVHKKVSRGSIAETV